MSPTELSAFADDGGRNLYHQMATGDHLTTIRQPPTATAQSVWSVVSGPSNSQDDNEV